MKHILSILLFIGLSLHTFSQQIPGSKSVYYGRASAGVLAGNTSSMSFLGFNGITLNHFDLGLGLGFESHDNNGYAPILIESRYNFGKGATQPFIGISGGYLASLNGYYSYHGGYTTGATIGLTHYVSKHIGITTSLGYRFSYTHNRVPHLTYYSQGAYPGQDLIRNMHRIEFRVGIAFR